MKRAYKLLSIILALVMVIGMLPMAALTASARTVLPQTGTGNMNLQMSPSGVLTWDSIEGATGYYLTIGNVRSTNYLDENYTDTSFNFIENFDSRKIDSGAYKISISANGSGLGNVNDSLTYYYVSPHDKLEAPTNLRWSGTTAMWDSTPNATGYTVYLFKPTGTQYASFKIDGNSNTSKDFSDIYGLNNSWYFQVEATSNTTAPETMYRTSARNESPKIYQSRENAIYTTDGNIGLRMSEDGVLAWNSITGAVSYNFSIGDGKSTYYLQEYYTKTSFNLLEDFDSRKLESGPYDIYVSARGPDNLFTANGKMIYYYVSPYNKLEAPCNLRWSNTTAMWDAVSGATGYTVYLFTPNGTQYASYPIEGNANTSKNFYDIPGISAGWWFTVEATSTEITPNMSCRDSSQNESPKSPNLSNATYDVNCYAYDIKNQKFAGGTVTVETDTESQSGTTAFINVNDQTVVKITAVADKGYNFVEWRKSSPDSPSAAITKNSDYALRIRNEEWLYAVFEKDDSVITFPEGTGTIDNPVVCSNFAELKYALEHPTIQGILVNNFANDTYQTFYTLQKEKDFEKGHCAITVPMNTTKYLTINADINIRVPYIDYLLYSFIDNRGSLTVGGTGSLNVSMNARGYPSAIIYNNGELNIGGNVTFDPTNKSFDSMHGYSIVTASGSTVINSGTFIGYATSAVLYQQGSLDIYDGTFKIINGNEQAFGLNTDTYLTMEEHNVNLYGGTFYGVRADQSIGADIVKLPDLLGYGAYYTYYSDDSKFDSSGKLDTHETLTVKMNNIVRDIELTIDAPKQNGTPDQTVICGDYAYKQATGNDDMWDDVDVYWEQSSDGQTWTKMASNSTFTVGYHYRAAVNVMTRNGNIFDIDSQIEPNVVAIVNGYYAEVFRYPEEDPGNLICVRFDFGILNDNIIEQIDIDGVVEPVVGEYPNYNCVISGTGYTVNTAYDNGTYAINGICWYDVTFDMWMKPNMTFQIGHEYKVIVDVKTEDGYEFYTTNIGSSYRPEGWGYINGNYATFGIQSDARFEQSLSWTFTCQPKTFKSVGITGLDVPTDSFTPDFDAVTDSEYYTVESIVWMDCENNADEMTASDTFVAGNKYWALITIVPKEVDGNKLCKFLASNKTIATLNGVKVEKVKNDSWQDVTSSVKAVRIYYTFTALGEENYSISGTITSGGDNTAPITVQLIPEGLPEVTYETIVTGNDASYYFAGITPGTYDVKVTKADHDEFVGTVTVTNDNVMYNVTLKYNDPNSSVLYGDANGDGKINTRDAALVMQYANGWEVTIDVAAADVNGDGKVNTRDYALLTQYANGWSVILGPKS